jgi:hypothetical protein
MQGKGLIHAAGPEIRPPALAARSGVPMKTLATISPGVSNATVSLRATGFLENRVNTAVWLRSEPSPRGGNSEPPSIIQEGWEVRIFPAESEVFFLTLPFIERLAIWRMLRSALRDRLPFVSQLRLLAPIQTGHRHQDV